MNCKALVVHDFILVQVVGWSTTLSCVEQALNETVPPITGKDLHT